LFIQANGEITIPSVCGSDYRLPPANVIEIRSSLAKRKKHRRHGTELGTDKTKT